MDFATLMGPAVVAAGVSGVITVVGMLITKSTTIGVHREKIQADQELARQKFDYDKQQAIFKRRFELAEQILTDAYKFRSLMNYVRNGAAFGNEGSTRQAAEQESDNLKHRRDVYFVPLERLIRENDFLGAMFARSDASQAHFGPNAKEAYALMQQSVTRVRVASSMLVEKTNEYATMDAKLIRKLECDIWAGMAEVEDDGKDRITADIETAVALIEEICGPVLKWLG
ncbi:hypothetical protein A6U86_29500 [Rhizobium sp. AC27/96]|uniref:hypothetical protein n=1 Tax=Rhizobium sp. AC27/96 TaxID=1841653 RepID=UPI000827ED5A|nr:hypothetical protein [Rhizobium sp. AC27/96]OCJ05395.1 hypothetical protein A6U86_29500 [Rhizobium sp. AC27/96]